MKRTVFLLAIVALLVACQESLEDRCAREAKEYTEKKCPTLVIKDVTLDSLRFEKAIRCNIAIHWEAFSMIRLL